MTKIEVRFMNLDSGAFRTVKTQTYDTATEAYAAVVAHAESAGFSNVKTVDTEDDGMRYTARTPGGRSGRNIAFGDYVQS